MSAPLATKPDVPDLPADPSPVVPRPARSASVWGFVLFGLVAVVPAAIAVLQLGRIHPDEVYQYLEPAFFRVHGYGVLAWEWHVGLRNWAIPLVLSWMLRLCGLVGIRDPQGCRAVLELPHLVLHVAMLWAVFRFARRRVSPRAALLATVAVGLFGPVLIYGGRTLGESFSTAFFVLGIEALDRPTGSDDRPIRSGVLGGVWLGLSVVARYGSAVLVLAALAHLLARRRWRLLAGCCGAGLLVALGLGGLDWATWGAPFHSLIAYVRYNLISGGAARQFGSSPVSFYVLPLLENVAPWCLLGLGAYLWTTRTKGTEPTGRLRRWAPSLPLFAALVYLVVLAVTPHKEDRFLYPAWVLLAVAAAPAACGWACSLGRRLWVALACAGVLLLGGISLAFGPDVRGDQFRAIVAQSRSGAHGLLIVNEGLWGAGGFFYIGRRIPWLVCDHATDFNFRRAMRDPRFDRVVTFDGRALDALEADGFRVTGKIGRETLLAR